MKKLLFLLSSILLSFNYFSQAGSATAARQDIGNTRLLNIDSVGLVFNRTFTFTSSSNAATYTVANCVNQYTASSLTCYSVDIGINNCELLGLTGVSSHSNMPVFYITLYSDNVPMAADNATMTQTFANLSNYFIGAVSTSLAWISAFPKGFVGSWSSVANMQYIRGCHIIGSKLYFIIQISSGTTPNPNAQYSFKWWFRKN